MGFFFIMQSMRTLNCSPVCLSYRLPQVQSQCKCNCKQCLLLGFFPILILIYFHFVLKQLKGFLQCQQTKLSYGSTYMYIILLFMFFHKLVKHLYSPHMPRSQTKAICKYFIFTLTNFFCNSFYILTHKTYFFSDYPE